MTLTRLLLLALLGGLTAFDTVATFVGLGAEPFEHPTGLSLREASSQGNGHFFLFYTRSHPGGGISGGK